MSCLNQKALWAVAALWLSIASIAAAQENPIFKKLQSQGIQLANGKTAKIPEPVMADGLNANQQLEVMQKLVPAAQLGGFLDGTVSSNLALEMNGIPGDMAQDSIGRKIDIYFVAQGKLSTVASPAFMKQQVNAGPGGKGGQGKFLTNQELQAHGLQIAKDTNTFRERYTHMEFPIFNQVKVDCIGHGIETVGNNGAVLVAFELDPKSENTWQPGVRNALGNVVWGPPQKYSGAGGFVKVVELEGATPRVFVEYHLIFDEPHGWFNGQNTLTSDLPNKYQDDVRTFRRNLKTFVPNPQPAGGAAKN